MALLAAKDDTNQDNQWHKDVLMMNIVGKSSDQLSLRSIDERNEGCASNDCGAHLRAVGGLTSEVCR